MEQDPKNTEIIQALETKAGAKQAIYRKTLSVFTMMKQEVEKITNEISRPVRDFDKSIEVSCQEEGTFEMNMKFSGDTLSFLMHSNIFNFPPEHFIHKTPYVEEDPMRAYCGMIMIYDFLSDSLKYNRMNDVGYMVARIFVNKDGHFFVQGKRQFSFLYNDFSAFEINQEVLRLIIQTAILNTIDFDLYVPPVEAVKEMSVMQKMAESGNAAIKTGKRLGFNYFDDEHRTPGF